MPKYPITHEMSVFVLATEKITRNSPKDSKKEIKNTQ